MRKLWIIAAIAVNAVLSAPSNASEAVSVDMASRLDKATADFTLSAAAERRVEIFEETQRRQRRPQQGPRGRDEWGGGRGYGRGYGPRRGYDAPPPRYRRPPPPYGYRYDQPRW